MIRLLFIFMILLQVPVYSSTIDNIEYLLDIKKRQLNRLNTDSEEYNKRSDIIKGEINELETTILQGKINSGFNRIFGETGITETLLDYLSNLDVINRDLLEESQLTYLEAGGTGSDYTHLTLLGYNQLDSIDYYTIKVNREIPVIESTNLSPSDIIKYDLETLSGNLILSPGLLESFYPLYQKYHCLTYRDIIEESIYRGVSKSLIYIFLNRLKRLKVITDMDVFIFLKEVNREI